MHNEHERMFFKISAPNFSAKPLNKFVFLQFLQSFKRIFAICRILEEHQFLLLIILLAASEFFSQSHNTVLRSHDTYSFGNQCLDYYF